MSEKNTKDLQKKEKVSETKDDKVKVSDKKINSKSLKKDSPKESVGEKPKRKTTRKSKTSDKKVSTTSALSTEKDIEEKTKKKTSRKAKTPKIELDAISTLSIEEPKKTKAKKTASAKKVSNEKEEKKTTKTTKKVTKSKTSNDAEEKVAKKTSTKKATVKKVVSKSRKTVTKTSKSNKKTNKKIIKSVKTMSLANQLLRKNVEILQYFELPYRYNETTVKILAQTPKTLFVYWDIADHDIDQYRLNYGDNFFNETYPVLLVKNETYGYVEEITINDFANSWYLHIKDPNSKYSIELGRRYQNKSKFESPYIYVKNSNEIIVPNDKVLIDTLKPTIKYRNVKTNEVTYKNINNIIKNEQILDLYSLYQFIYNTENITESFDFLNNPSSGNPTSSFK